MKRNLVWVAALLGLSGLTWAQESPLEPPDLARYLRWGPVRARPGFLISNVGYDNNIYYRTVGQPQVGDYTATLSPKLDGLVLLGHTGFLVFTEQINYTAYWNTSKLNYFEQLGSARLTIPFRRFGLYVEGALNDTKDRPADVLDVRLSRREKRFGAGLIVKAGWRTDLELGGVRSDWRNQDPDNPAVGPELDRVEQGVRFRGRYLVFGRTRMTLDAAHRTITFDDPSQKRDCTERRLLPGVEFGVGGRLSGSAHGGWSRLRAEDPSKPGFSGPIGDVHLAYRIGSGTTIQVTGRRDLEFAIWQDTTFLLNGTYELRAIQYFNRMLGFEAGAGRGRITFPGSSNREDRSTWIDAGVRLRFSESDLGRRVEYVIKATRWQVVSTPEAYSGLSQSRNTVGISAIIGY